MTFSFETTGKNGFLLLRTYTHTSWIKRRCRKSAKIMRDIIIHKVAVILVHLLLKHCFKWALFCMAVMMKATHVYVQQVLSLFFLVQIGRKLIFRCARHRTDARDGCHFSCHEINRINVQCTVHHCRLDYVAFVFWSSMMRATPHLSGYI